MGSDWNRRDYDDRPRYNRDTRDTYNDYSNYETMNNREAYEYRSKMENYDYQNRDSRDRDYRERDRNYDRYDKRELNKDNRFNDKFKSLFSKKEKAEYEPKPEPQSNFGNNMIIYSPKTYRDVKKLIDYLKNREPIIVDLAEIKHEKGQRILDFLSGAIYALNGSMHKISGSIYLLTPDGVNIMVPTELKERIERDNG